MNNNLAGQKSSVLQDGAEKEEGRCMRTSGHVTGYFVGVSREKLSKGPTNTMLFSDYQIS